MMNLFQLVVLVQLLCVAEAGRPSGSGDYNQLAKLLVFSVYLFFLALKNKWLENGELLFS